MTHVIMTIIESLKYEFPLRFMAGKKQNMKENKSHLNKKHFKRHTLHTHVSVWLKLSLSEQMSPQVQWLIVFSH